MQNFTLGKKGISMLFFAFILLIGSLPSYGQTCPTVGDTSPEDFCYLSRVSDLTDATSTTISSGSIAYYRTATSRNAIPNDELLQDGTYFAGNASGSCITRTAITVAVDDFGAPDPLFGNVFSPCVYGEEPTAGNSDPSYIKTVQDLIDNIDGNNVEIFDNEFDATKLNENTPLVRGENYFAGQRNPDSGCTTSRVAIRYDPIYSPAPAAAPIQVVCEGSTVANLEASATTPLSQGFRWYSTNDSQPALDASTPLIDGEDYYVSQIVNRAGRNEPPCESTDRVMVTVQFDDINAGNPNSETYCKSEFDSQLAQSSTTNGRSRFEELFLQLLDAGVPTDGTFDPTPTDLGTAPQTYTTTYTITSTGGCEDSVELTINVTEDPTTGGNINEQVCRNEFPETITPSQVESYFRGLVNTAGGEAGGTFNNDDMTTIASDFNSTTTFPRTFSSEYTIRQGTACESTSTVQIEVLESPDAGADNSETYCVAEIQDEINNTNGRTFQDLFEELLESGVTGGTFDPTPAYAGPGTYTSTYTIELPNECTDSATITVVVNDPSAGDDSLNNQLCRADLPPTVTTEQVEGYFRSLLSSDADTNGVFDTDDIATITANFNSNDTYPAPFNTTYTVAGGTPCESTANFSVTVYEAPNAGPDITDSICISELEAIAAGYEPSNPEATIFTLLDRFGYDGDMTGTFSPDAETLGNQLLAYYANPTRPASLLLSTTYTVASNNTVCADDVAQFNITVNDTQDANAGNIDNQQACSNQGIINLNDYLAGSGATPGGTFSGQGVLADGQSFDTSIGSQEGGYTITYTVDDNSVCTTAGTSASDDFILTINDSLDSTAPINRSFCIADLDPNLSENDVINYFNSLVSSFPAGTFSTSPSDIYTAYKNNPINTFTTTYTVAGGDCGGSVDISVTVNDVKDAEAGTIADQVACSNDGLINLNDYLTDPNTTPGGTFSGEGVLEDGQTFDSSIGSQDGGYDITYTVNGTTSCVTAGTSDSQVFNLTVNDAPNAGADLTPSFCTAEIDNLIANPSQALNFLNDLIANQGDDVDTDGSFNRTVADFANYYTNGDFSSPFLATYTVTNSSCTDSANIAITITPVQEVTVTPIDDFKVCSSTDDLNLFTYLNVTGGTFFYGSTEIENGLVDVSTLGSLPEITYSVNEDIDTTDCIQGSDSTIFTITVVAPVNAGRDRSVNLCQNEIAQIVAEGTARNYYLNLLDAGVSRDGSFSPTIQTLVDRYNNSTDKAGTYTSTYTVQNGSCTDSAEISVVVTPNLVLNAGNIADQAFCSNEDPILLSNLLDGSGATPGGTFSGNGVSEDGTMFDPSVGPNTNGYTITYTIDRDSNPCVTGSATSTFVITVNDPSQADAGTIANQTVCSSDDAISLTDFLSGSGASLGGTFSGEGVNSEGTMFDPSVGPNENGYSITYTVSEDNIGACVIGSASSTFVITVTDPTPANAGNIADQSVCTNDDAINLADYLTDSGASLGGTFSGNGVSEDGTMFDPSVGPNADGYTITYTVNEENADACVTGEASSTFTITVNGVSEAPVADAEQSFCFINNPTVADLSATGSNIVWYEDADLTVVAESTDPLITGEDYYAVATAGENSCGSAAVMVNVTINDSDAPTLSFEGNEFCRQDNPTVQDLINNVTGGSVKIYTTAEGGTAIATSTALVNGTTYYATSTDSEFGCESTERLAITAKVGFCGIPEGFSPNGDSINDRFVIPDIAIDYPNYTIEIFNRWGQVVFEGNASTGDWDGVSNRDTTLGNDVLPVGVYFYILKYNDGVTAPVQGKLYLSR